MQLILLLALSIASQSNPESEAGGVSDARRPYSDE